MRKFNGEADAALRPGYKDIPSEHRRRYITPEAYYQALKTQPARSCLCAFRRRAELIDAVRSYYGGIGTALAGRIFL